MGVWEHTGLHRDKPPGERRSPKDYLGGEESQLAARQSLPCEVPDRREWGACRRMRVVVWHALTERPADHDLGAVMTSALIPL